MAARKVSLSHRLPNNLTPNNPAAKPAPLPTPSKEGGRGVGGLGLCATGLKIQVEIDVDTIISNLPAGQIDVQQVLDALTVSQKQAVYDHLAMELRDVEPAEREVDMWVTSVHQALVDALGGGGGGVPGPMIVRGLLRPRSAWAPIEGFMQAHGFTEMKVAERLSIYRLLARVLVLRCQEIARRARIPLGPKLVAHNVGDIAAIVDASFPGYAQAGALQMVAQQLLNGEQREDDA